MRSPKHHLDVGHLVHSLELPADVIVNTLGLPLALLDLVIAISLVVDDLLRPLLHDLGAGGGSDGHFEC